MDECICNKIFKAYNFRELKNIFVHIAWCPQSFEMAAYKRELEEYKKKPWYLRLFMFKPQKP